MKSRPTRASALFCCTCLAALLTAAPAAAQIVADQTEKEAEPSGEIIVTAQRRSENIQKVPLSIQAFDSVTLSRASAKGVEDLPLVTSGLTMTRTAAASVPYIRGIGSPSGNPGEESTVPVYVDGVLRGSLNATQLSFSDTERVEVLKGPQGTLFGRNATGGLIHIITREPSSDSSGQFLLSAGNYETFEASAYGTTGLVPNVAVSLGGYTRRQMKGYGRNLVTGRDTSYANESSARGKLRFHGGDTSLVLAADYSVRDDPRGFTRTPPPGAIGGVRGGTPAQQFTYVGDWHDLAHNVDDKVRTNSWGVSATLQQGLGALDLVSITAYRDDYTDILTDNDYGSADLSRADFGFTVRNFTQEVRMSSDDTGAFNWLIGGFYLQSYAANRVNIQTLPSNVFTRYAATNRTRSYSAFGEVSLKLFDDAGKITLGARYTIDKRRIAGVVNGAAVPGPTVNPRYKGEDPTYRAVYSHQLTPDIMAYGSYNRGYKSGNYNIIPATTNAYQPEYVNAYEVGLKGNAFDNALRFSMSAFYNDYTNIQVTVSTGTTTTTLNAASATIKGVEGEFNIRLISGLTMDLVGGYTDSRYDSFRNAAVFIPNRSAAGVPNGGNSLLTGYDATGNPLQRSPKFTGSAGLSYTSKSDSGRINASVRGFYNSGFNWEPSGRLRQREYALLNASVGYESDAGWGLRLSGNNLTDTNYAITSGAGTASDFFAAADPATYTLAATFRF